MRSAAIVVRRHLLSHDLHRRNLNGSWSAICLYFLLHRNSFASYSGSGRVWSMLNKFIFVAFLTVGCFLSVSSQVRTCDLTEADLPLFDRVRYGMTVQDQRDGTFGIGIGQGAGPLWPGPNDKPFFEYQAVTFRAAKVIRIVGYHRPDASTKPVPLVKAMTQRYSIPTAAWHFWDMDEQAIAYCKGFTIHITYATTTVSPFSESETEQ